CHGRRDAEEIVAGSHEGGHSRFDIGPGLRKEADAHGVRAAFFVVRPNAVGLTEIADLVDSGKVKPVGETVLPLSEARKAQELSQTGHTRGKIVLKVA